MAEGSPAAVQDLLIWCLSVAGRYSISTWR